MGPKEQHDSEFPGISLGLLCPRLSNREADNLDTPKGTNKKSPKKEFSLQPKDQWKDILTRLNMITAAKHASKKDYNPKTHPTSRDSVDRLAQPKPSSAWEVSKRTEWRAKNFITIGH